MINLCTPKKCPYFKGCKQKKNYFLNNTICQGGQKYANQDYVSLKERTFSELQLNIKTIECLEVFAKEDIISKKELIIRLSFKKIDIKEIAKIANCSVQYVYSERRKALKKSIGE